MYYISLTIMKNFIKKGIFGAAVIAMASFASCEDETVYEIYQTPTDIPFEIAQTSYEFKGNATRTQSVDIKSAVWPTLTTNGNWREYYIEEFTPRYNFQYHILPKASLDEQNYTITVKSQEETKTINIHQTPADPGFMGLGWNLGNQLEASTNGVANETCWGNAAATQATMDGVKAAGFESVRIPITWRGHIGDAPEYTLEADWLNRVAEVVDYAMNAGLKAIINIHHDDAITSEGVSETNAWINVLEASKDSAKNAQMTEEIKAVWTQIANRFKEVSADNLMFESFNEVQDGGWGYGPSASDNGAQYAVLNAWNQAVVDVIRATGGNNSTRWIGVPTYAASATFIDNLVIPTDAANKVAVGIHCYDPYKFCISAEANTWGTDAEYTDTEEFMFKLADKFLNEGKQVYIGEFGCVKRANPEDEPYRLAWLKNFTRMARTYGLSLFLWDNGANAGGNESHAYINHGNGQVVDETAAAALKAITDGYNNVK